MFSLLGMIFFSIKYRSILQKILLTSSILSSTCRGVFVSKELHELFYIDLMNHSIDLLALLFEVPPNNCRLLFIVFEIS